MRALRSGGEDVEVHPLLPQQVDRRQLKVGRLLLDNSKSQKYTNVDRYMHGYTVAFPEISCRIIRDVVVHGLIPVHESGAIVDHLRHYYPAGNAPESSTKLLAGRVDEAIKQKASYGAEYEECPHLTLVVYNEGGGTWGHWVVENFPKIPLFLARFPEGKVALPIGYKNNNFGALLDVCGISRDSIFFYSGPYRLKQAAFIDHLYEEGTVHPWVIDYFKGASCTRPLRPSRLFIERAARTREITNLPEVKRVAQEHGFTSKPLGSATLQEQVEQWTRADCLLTTLGSDLTNIVFCQPGPRLFVISPDFHGDRFFIDLAAAFGCEWNELLCGTIVEERSPRNTSSFSVSPLALNRLLD
ncbi:glycosyltransferase family 61 protein [Paracoccus liaowanqingii]|uniref:Glycosyltransferase family 61 protein n=1 Tax=Paracoccus liaowanqingii TaxID=2560053 RepID=A0A4Z1CKE4_9RHOB|nr:glycosyltransferase family 61 protein [Paracoccus liaowanqingii]TGN50058.1 glycosyltransferase family 61 protein [Paracoccus liaowanqingii]